MPVTLAVYSKVAPPDAENFLKYVGNIEEVTGRIFDGRVVEADNKHGEHYIGLFRILDMTIDLDHFYLIFLEPDEPEDGDEIGLARLQAFLIQEFTFWQNEIGGMELIDTYRMMPSGARVYKIKCDLDQVNGIFTHVWRKNFHVVKDSE